MDKQFRVIWSNQINSTNSKTTAVEESKNAQLPAAAFWSGQEVLGQVVLQLEKEMNIRTICISINGEAKVNWTEKNIRIRTFPSVWMWLECMTFSSTAVYLKQRTILLEPKCPDPGADSSVICLPAGEHVFPFSFQIPKHCPPSFEGKFGHIRYSCLLEIDRPWKLIKRINLPIIIWPYMDLEKIQWAPQEQKLEERINYGFCKSGNLISKVTVPKVEFIHGETIPIRLEIKNLTSRAVVRTGIRLREIAKYTARRMYPLNFDLCTMAVPLFPPTSNSFEYRHMLAVRQTTEKTVECIKECHIPSASNDIIEIPLHIPAECTPSFLDCPNLQIWHKLEVVIYLSGISYPFSMGSNGPLMSVLIRAKGDRK